MKPAKSFVVEIKRKGRRQAVRDQEPLWDPKLLKAATDAVEESQKASEPDATLASKVGRPGPGLIGDAGNR